MIYFSKAPPENQRVEWYNEKDGQIYIFETEKGKWVSLKWRRIPFYQRAIRFLFGWWIGRYWANKNDRYLCALIGLSMCDLEITPGMLARKRYLYGKCEWWGTSGASQ